LPDNLVEPVVAAIIKTTATGKIGDGKIFLSNIIDAIRIRNPGRGTEALSRRRAITP
jgi:nitrogen regulatory protein P-II 1